MFCPTNLYISLILISEYLGHVREGSSSGWYGSKDSSDHVAKEEEIESGGDSGENDEAKSQIGAKVSDPDRIEWILELDTYNEIHP